MNRMLRFLAPLLPFALLGFTVQARAAVAIGLPAPDFSIKDSQGKTVRLSDYSGRIVVLEWTNGRCPAVQKHYRGNLQSLQRGARAQGVVWLSVIAPSPGDASPIDGATADKLTLERDARPAKVLPDPDGKLARLYGAKLAPELFIINARGTLAYAGAIDSIDSADVADITRAEPYAANALGNLINGQPVKKPATPPYGCAIRN